jgi:hypothetical protein
MAMTRKRATALFRELGAKDPEAWAASEGEHPSLVRFLFLTGLWRFAIGNDARWMTSWADSAAPIPAAIQRMLDRGVDPADLTDVVRDMQVEALFNVCCLLDNPGHGIEDLQAKIPENVEWRLAEFDGEQERLGRAVHALHESFHQLDPTGRGGEPPPRTAPAKPKTRSKKRR